MTEIETMDENLDIRDPATRGDLEQTLVACLEQLEASVNAMDECERDVDNDLEVKPDPVKLEPLKLEELTFGEGGVRLEQLKRSTTAHHNAGIRVRIRELLTRDEYVMSAARYYDLAPGDWIKDVTEGEIHHVRFTIKKSEFQEWRTYHAGAIGCHGPPQTRKDRTAGGISGKKREVQKASIKIHCPAQTIAKETPMGTKERAMAIDLYYHCAHPLASLEDNCTRQESDRFKAVIKGLLLQGSSIKNVMERLTKNYDRFMDIVTDVSRE